jgi:transposase
MSVHHWIDCYDQTRDPTSLLDHRGGNHPTAWTEELEVVLSASLARRPADFGYQAMGWTVSLLQQHLARWGGQWLSATTLRRKLDELGYTWKRPRYVLDPDPERGKKTPHPLAVAAVGPGVRPAV